MKREFTGIVGTHQTPLLEQCIDEHVGSQWLVWLSYNASRTEGVYLRLWASGRITKESLTHDGGVSNVSTIKPEVEKKRFKKVYRGAH